MRGRFASRRTSSAACCTSGAAGSRCATRPAPSSSRAASRSPPSRRADAALRPLARRSAPLRAPRRGGLRRCALQPAAAPELRAGGALRTRARDRPRGAARAAAPPRRAALGRGAPRRARLRTALRAGPRLAPEAAPAGLAGGPVPEVGAGVGSATEALLEALAERDTLGALSAYLVTEPVALFRRRAERTLRAAHPGAPLAFAALDVNAPWAAQGVAPGSVRLVWGVNVFHLARDLEAVLAEARAA